MAAASFTNCKLLTHISICYIRCKRKQNIQLVFNERLAIQIKRKRQNNSAHFGAVTMLSHDKKCQAYSFAKWPSLTGRRNCAGTRVNYSAHFCRNCLRWYDEAFEVSCGSVNCERASVCEQVAERTGRNHDNGSDRNFDKGRTLTTFTDFEHFVFH
jgi:hypothetical protein